MHVRRTLKVPQKMYFNLIPSGVENKDIKKLGWGAKFGPDGSSIIGWNWDVGAEFRISIKKPELQGLRP